MLSQRNLLLKIESSKHNKAAQFSSNSLSERLSNGNPPGRTQTTHTVTLWNNNNTTREATVLGHAVSSRKMRNLPKSKTTQSPRVGTRGFKRNFPRALEE